MTTDQVVAKIRELARTLGRSPRRADMVRGGISMRRIYLHFDSIIDAYRAAGLAPCGSGYPMDPATLLLDWAAVTRKLGRPPSENQYARPGKQTCAPSPPRWPAWDARPPTARP